MSGPRQRPSQVVSERAPVDHRLRALPCPHCGATMWLELKQFFPKNRPLLRCVDCGGPARLPLRAGLAGVVAMMASMSVGALVFLELAPYPPRSAGETAAALLGFLAVGWLGYRSCCLVCRAFADRLLHG